MKTHASTVDGDNRLTPLVGLRDVGEEKRLAGYPGASCDGDDKK